MALRLERLRERTNGYTLTSRQYVLVAYCALVALTLIVLTGAAVRLTDSGLGCPQWPECYGKLYPPLSTHAVIEFSNRVISVPVVLAAGFAWLGALRRRPYRRDLVWLGALLPIGVVCQAVLGGLTVRGKLDYGWVMGHFSLSMLILVAATALAWRAQYEPDRSRETLAFGAGRFGDAGRSGDARHRRVSPGFGGASVSPIGPRFGQRPRGGDRTLVWSARALVALGALTIFAGTAATAAGPHAGGNPGEPINRLDFHGRGTMDFVIHRHAEIAVAFGLLALLVWWLARRRDADPAMRRSTTLVCVLLALQGAVGLDQYETHLPTELVWVHVGLACACWIAALWTLYAAGRLPQRAPVVQERPAPPPPVRVSA
ncbi:MAG TPA: COX15/CtaA family protein [Solirubrobacteraceae bacterium]|jgi:cytochrome c oxidase assembly protein subunit 15|nr:COX15/CtaA family protein [Solirubrobacteraceae bacterium]